MCPVRAVLNSGSNPSSVSDRVVRKLQARFSSISITQSMEGAHCAKLADGSLVFISQKACLLQLTSHTEWCPVVLEPSPDALMPGEDDTILSGGATLKKLGIDVCGSFAARAHSKPIACVKGMENPTFNERWRVAVAVKALQRVVDEKPMTLNNEAVARALFRGPNMFMVPEEE